MTTSLPMSFYMKSFIHVGSKRFVKNLDENLASLAGKLPVIKTFRNLRCTLKERQKVKKSGRQEKSGNISKVSLLEARD